MIARIAYGVSAIFFAYATVVQFNDVDAAIWITVYGAACLICLAAIVVSKPIAPLAFVTACAALCWAMSIAPLLFSLPVGDDFFANEVAREFCGLLIVFVALTAVALSKKKRLRKSSGQGVG